MLETRATPWVEELAGLVGAVEISSDESFTFGGIANTGGQGTLVERLAAAFYQRGYCNRFDCAPTENGDRIDMTADLSAANTSILRSHPGWRIVGVEQSGRIEAEKGGCRRSFEPGEYVSLDGQGVPPHTGGSVTIHLQRESTSAQPGYYAALGETLADDSESTLVRFYWNVAPPSAASLLAAVTRDLNAFEVPFRIKCPTLAQAYGRRDAAVLYVSARYYDIAMQLAARWAHDTRITLRSGVPLFSKPMACGVGIAEDPGGGESFGTNRCRLVAEAIVDARGASVSVAQKLEAVRDRFSQAGLDLERPYLNAASVDRYLAFAGHAP
jgi:hypothetical protein